MKDNIFSKNIKILFLILIALFLLTYKINKPFIGHHDWNSVFFANIAKNTAKFGFLKTKFGAVYSFLPKTEADFRFHTHQPPILHLLLGLEAKIIGVQEWSMRLLAIIFSLVALYFFFKIAELLFDQKIALIASLLFIFNPMFLYFGKMPVHEIFGLPLIALSIYRYIIFFRRQERKNYFWLILSLTLACQTVWSGYYLAPLFAAHYWFFNPSTLSRIKFPKGKKILLLILVPIISFLTHLLHGLILKGEWDNYLFSTLLFRMQLGEKASMYKFTILQYIKTEALWLTVYFTRILCFLNLIYYLLLGKKIIKRKLNPRDGFLLMIIAFGFIDPIIFRNLCFIHDYKLYYFLLSIPLLAAVSLFYLKRKLEFFWKKSNLIAFLTFCLVFILFAAERIKFTKALLETAINKKAYDLGLIIQKKSNEGEVVLVAPPSFVEFEGIFLKFYAQREIIYFNPNLSEFNKFYSDKTGLVTFVKNDEGPTQSLLEFLKGNYSFFKTENFLIFDLKEK